MKDQYFFFCNAVYYINVVIPILYTLSFIFKSLWMWLYHYYYYYYCNYNYNSRSLLSETRSQRVFILHILYKSYTETLQHWFPLLLVGFSQRSSKADFPVSSKKEIKNRLIECHFAVSSHQWHKVRTQSTEDAVPQFIQPHSASCNLTQAALTCHSLPKCQFVKLFHWKYTWI